MATKRRAFDSGFKLEVVKMVQEQGLNIAQVFKAQAWEPLQRRQQGGD